MPYNWPDSYFTFYNIFNDTENILWTFQTCKHKPGQPDM